LPPKPPDSAEIKKGIEIEFNAYVHEIQVLGSLREYLETMKITSYIEKKIDKKDGNYKTPDLLICSENYLVVDHKYTESIDEKTLADKVNEMSEYRSAFLLHDSKSNKDIEFDPECVMLVPESAVKHFKNNLNCPVTWGYKLNDDVTIEQGIGSVQDTKILSLFNPSMWFPKAEEIAKYKFVISHAPLAYTSSQVYAILWTLMSSPSDYFATEFKVKYDTILDQFNHLFPQWVSPEVKQMNVTRLKDALIFLQELSWVRWLESDKEVIVYKQKGRHMGETISYLIEQQAKRLYRHRLREYERATEAEEKQKGKQTTLNGF
jgi:hypothetical protein